MTQKTILAETMETADDKARLDEVCKQLLANKIILAWIMKCTMEEYRNLDVDEIAERYIEGEPAVARMAVHRNTGRNPKTVCIHGDDTVDKTIEEGTIFFDIRFRALLPHDGEYITLLINVEAQNDFYPGYSLTKRGIY